MGFIRLKANPFHGLRRITQQLIKEETLITPDTTLPQPNASGRQEVAILLVSQALYIAVGVLTKSLLAYSLLPEGLGSYFVCVLFGALAGTIGTLATERGVQYFVAAKRMSVSEGMSIAFAICLIGSAVVATAALPLIHSGFSFFLKADKHSFYLALLLVPSSSLMFAARLQLQGLRRFTQLAIISLIQAAVGVVSILTLVWGLGLGVNGAILSLFLGHLVLIVAAVADLRRHCGLVLAFPSREGIKRVFIYGLKEYVARIGQTLDPRVGSLLLGIVASRADIGLFTASNALITRVLILPTAVATYLLPRVAGNDSGQPELAAFCARVTWWTVGGLLLIWFAVSTPLVPLLLSESFTPVVRLTWIMSIGVFAYAGTEIFVAYFRGVNRPQVFSHAMWLSLSANVVLFFGLYPAWGLTGAAWSLTGGLLCRSFFLWLMFQRATGLPLYSTLILRRSDVAYLWSAGASLVRLMAAR